MKTNAATKSARTPCARTHEGAVAQKVSPLLELRRTVLSCLLWEDTFYESGSNIADRISKLVTVCSPSEVATLAIDARDRMYLRHVPLFLLSELSKRKGYGDVVGPALEHVIQRADELSEFLAIYWKQGKHPIAPSVKRALARAFTKFNEYQLAKYNRDAAVKLRDVMFLVHPKPKDKEQAGVFRRLAEKTLEAPDTWEVALSAGKDKKETFERLLQEGTLGGMALLRNLRNMVYSGVNDKLIRRRLAEGAKRALPFRFIAAARHAPTLESDIEAAMLKSTEEIAPLAGSTVLLVDVSGSMNCGLSAKSDMTRMDAACGLAILLREKCEDLAVITFSNEARIVPARRGFALRDSIVDSQDHYGTYLRASLDATKPRFGDRDRLIVLTDEQSHDGTREGFAPHSYMVNVAPYRHGLSYGNGWTHIDGWSERILDFIQEYERVEAN